MNYKNQTPIQEILAKWQVNQNGNVIHTVIHKEDIKEHIKESNELEISTNDVYSHDPIQGELDQLSNKTTIWWIKFPKMY
jgi:pimeloyl-CoA synthetase